MSDELLGWASRSAGSPDSRATFTSPCRVPEPLLSLPTTWTRMGLSEELWHHQYWLPPGATWEDMKEAADTHYPKPQDLWLCLPSASPQQWAAWQQAANRGEGEKGHTDGGLLSSSPAAPHSLRSTIWVRVAEALRPELLHLTAPAARDEAAKSITLL